MTQTNIDRFLASVKPFAKLPAAAQKELASVSHEKRFTKGETIFRAGDPAEAVWIVKEGRVHLMRFMEDGQASTTCVMANKELFCCLPALDRQPYPVDAVAAVESIVIKVPINAFHDLLQKNPAFLTESLCLFCDKLRDVENKSCMGYDAVDRRLAHTLLGMYKKFGASVPLTKHELAELASTTVETTIRVLSQWKKQGFIDSSRGSTTIQKLDELKKIAGQT